MSGLDPLRDPGRHYADRARAVGGQVVQLEAEGMIHGFVNMRGALPSAQQDVEAILAAGLALLP
jgi:acetyl esterase